MKLNIRDSVVLSNWLAGNATLSEVNALSSVGLVGNVRFSEKARNRYIYYWVWSTVRFSGLPGMLQEAFYKRHGLDGLNRRFARVNRVIQIRTGKK
jgi:hypothetical protein